MKIYSEKTNQEYASVDECLAAEEEFDKQAALEKAKKEELANTRKDRAKEVEDAYLAIIEAQKHFRKLLDAFTKDYGSFHMTVRTGEGNPFDLFDRFFKGWF